MLYYIRQTYDINVKEIIHTFKQRTNVAFPLQYTDAIFPERFKASTLKYSINSRG
ncbi:hypothetical protein X777_15376 [Ooceraea biroi]|uniref:Uncharacterized protein n=1 Tax=Ooceraea biroi TaxID=2015173 RepID=A0A026VV35_OOCBI|nr:hypothetical protein X777_15376 [Ooceraea biroi]